MMKPLVLAFAVLAMASELHSIGAHDLNVTSSTPLEHKHLRSNVVLTREPVPLQGLRGANALGTKKKEAAESLRRWLADKNNEAHPPPSNERSLKEKDKGKKEKVDKKPFVVELVKDISTYDGDPAELTELTSGLWVFRANKYYSDPHNDHFAHLYKTDGTEAGTEDITPDAAGNKRDSDNFFWLTLYNGKVYFVYYYITAPPLYTHKYQLWRTNGSTSEMIWDFVGGKVLEGSYKEEGMVVFDNKLYLPVIQGGSNFNTKLWRFEAFPDGTVDEHMFTSPSGVVPSTLTASHNFLFFVACYRDESGGKHCDLWKTNGMGTEKLTDDIFDHAVINNHRWYPQMVMYRGNLYFSGRSGYLLQSDGTSIVMVTDKVHLEPRLSVFNDRIYFKGTDGQLWISDGTEVGTKKVTNTLTVSYIVNWCNGKLFFGNRNTSCYHADDLWISDGKEGGKSDMVCQCCLSQNYPSAVWDNKLFFITDFNDTHRLKQVDGSKKGPPTLVTNEQNPQGWNNIRFIWTVESEDKLFFSGYGLNGTEDPVGKELWVIHY